MAGNSFWRSVYCHDYIDDIHMKSNSTYHFIKQIHLYSSLATVALLLMYVITSYMMIYHDWFKVERSDEKPITIAAKSDEVSDKNWDVFLRKNNISGRLTRENFEKNGDLARTYSTAKGNTKITLLNSKNEVEIVSTQLNMPGKIIGLHRLRGYGGSILYNIYAFLLDMVGISLILFAITGAILWLKLLNHNKIAWSILALGFIYVGAIVAYLLFV